MPARSRRSVLSTVASGAALAAAAVGAGGPAATAASGSGHRRISLVGRGLRRLDVRPATVPGPQGHAVAAVELPRAGDRCVVTAVVTTATGAAGTFHADVVALVDHGRSPELGAAMTYEQHLLTMPDGTIAGTGTTDRRGRGTYAVVGGTGTYAAARGTYRVELRRLDLGGDGHAHFDLALDTPDTPHNPDQ